MSRRLAAAMIALFVVVLSLLIAVGASRGFKHIEKRGPVPGRVAEILPGGLDATAGRIASVFNLWSEFERPDRTGSFPNNFPRDSQWSHFFLSRKDDKGLQLFPSDEEIRRNRGVDSFILSYVQIPPAKRARDFCLREPSGDFFWGSEYFYKNLPAKFRCHFLIHLEPADAAHTTVEIFEYQPYIWAGEYFGVSAHAILPTMLHDIRPVEPTTSDRRAILTLIEHPPNEPNPAGTQ